MLPKELKPKHCYNLVRLGKDNDGGYLVEKDSLLNSESLISFGINLDWSFEKDFFKLKERPIHCYDHTINIKIIKNIFQEKWFIMNQQLDWEKI